MEFTQVLKLRKSVRKYNQEKQITEVQLEKILFAGMAAPVSRKDYKSLKFTVIQDNVLLKEISDAFKEAEHPLYGVPTLILVSTQAASVENVEYFNVACIIENMLLAATDLGLGSIYLTSFLEGLTARKDLLDKLEIPDGYTPLSAVGVGYSAFEEKVANEETISKIIEVIRK